MKSNMNITQKLHYLIKIVFCVGLFFAFSCHHKSGENESHQLKKQQKGFIVFPSGEKMKVFFALTFSEQTKGLSGVSPNEFGNDEVLWFYYLNDDFRSFWMPNTYFNLDIIFIDKNLKVIRVIRDVPFHEGFKEPPLIPRTPSVYARHVLEIKSSSSYRGKFKEGSQLRYQGVSLQQIEQGIHPD